MKATRIYFLLLTLCLSCPGFAQSNAPSDYKHQHKSAEKYQKTLIKQHNKQAKEEAKHAKAWKKQHQQ